MGVGSRDHRRSSGRTLVKNKITLTAAPFSPTTCTFSWPGFSRFSGNCSYGNGTLEDSTVNGQHYSLDQFFTITIRGDQLPTEVCARVRQAVAGALAAPHPATKVPAGQYLATSAYRDGVPVIRRAATALTARLVATMPATDDGQCIEFDQSAEEDLTALRYSQERHWLALVSFGLLSMRFSTPSGRKIGGTHVYDTQFYLKLILDAAGSWTVGNLPALPQGNIAHPPPLAEQMAQSICDAGGHDLQGAMRHAHLDSSFACGGIILPGLQGMRGCWLDIETPNGPLHPPATHLWRFGALLAADARSHKLLPAILLAPTDELAAVPQQCSELSHAALRRGLSPHWHSRDLPQRR
ncbi:MAG TPA: hypothetical protein VGP82_23385 [Ktedonobacterales bacterium]|jgi:hypothetical protein|nr:hypothetical protein [Ktedonobacterales bacterium]